MTILQLSEGRRDCASCSVLPRYCCVGWHRRPF